MTKNYDKVLQVLQSETEFITSVRGITKKCDKKLLQSVTGITKCDNYDQVRQNVMQQSFRLTYTLEKMICKE